MSNVKSQKKMEKLQRESIKVMIRFRPSNKAEKIWNKQNKKTNLNYRDNQVQYLPQHQIKLLNTNGKKYQYGFDTILTPSSTQKETFEIVAEGVCDEILQGYNGTIFVYGQSGSGKTHTMFGPEEKKDEMDIASFGIIPMACAYIFTILNDITHPLSEDIADYNVRCEFIEIYNEKLRDLLNPKQTPEIREVLIHKKFVPVMQNVTTEQVSNLEECMSAIRTATSNRTVARTNLNATSSRSHMVMRLIVTIQTKSGMKKTGIGNFADLAGSERVKKTGAKGKQLKEAGNILKSLSALSNVIDSLEKGRKHIPFKDSKLTFMLKNSLGGNCKTTLLICASAHIDNRNETIRSIQFGMRCRNVQNVVCVNEVRTKQQLMLENDRLKDEIEALKKGAIASEEIINDKLNEIEMENFDLLKQNEGNDKTIDVLRQQLQQMSVDRDQRIEKEKELVDEIEILRESYNELKSNLMHKKSMNDIDEYKDELRDYERKVNDLGVSNESVMNENKELNIRNHELETVIKRLKDEISGKDDDVNRWKVKYERLGRENNEQQKHIVSMKSDVKQKSMLKDEIEILQKKWVGLKEELSDKDAIIKQKNDLFMKYKELSESNSSVVVKEIKMEVRCNDKTHDELVLRMDNVLNELNDSKMKSKLRDKEYNKMLLKYENVMIELKNEHNKSGNLKLSFNKLESKSQTLRRDKYKIEDKYNRLFTEHNDLQNRLDVFKKGIKSELNKYTQNISKLKSRMNQQQESSLKILSNLKNIEKSQLENETTYANKLEELEIQTEEQNNTIKQLNQEIKKLKQEKEKYMQEQDASHFSLDSQVIEEKVEENSSQINDHESEETKANDDTKQVDIENKKQMDWDFILNQCHPRTRSSAFVRLPKAFEANITPGIYTKTRGENISRIKVSKPRNGILYDDDGDRSELDKLEMETEMKSNVSGIEKYRRKKRKKYSKRKLPKPRQTFDTFELEKYNKLLSPRVSVYQNQRKLSKSERIVREQTLSLGNFFENHLHMQKQKDERMEKVFDAMENSKRKASAVKNKIGNKMSVKNKESDSIVLKKWKSNESNDNEMKSENIPDAIPKSWDDDIYDNPINPNDENSAQNVNIKANKPDAVMKLKSIQNKHKWFNQMTNNHRHNRYPHIHCQSMANVYQNVNNNNENNYNEIHNNGHGHDAMGRINRSVSSRNILAQYNTNESVNTRKSKTQTKKQKVSNHKYSASQHTLLSQHISDKYHHSYSVHTKEHKKKKRKSKKDRSEENAKLALIYDNEYKAMKRRYQQKKRKRLLSKANADNMSNNITINNTNNEQSLAADAYDSDHDHSKNVPL